MTSNLGQPQPMIPQQMPLNRPINSNQMMSGPTPNYNPNSYEPFPSYQQNQPLLMNPNNGPPFQPQTNFGHNYQLMENQRFPVHQNFNQKMGFPSQQSFQSHHFLLIVSLEIKSWEAGKLLLRSNVSR